jgi:transposase
MARHYVGGDRDQLFLLATSMRDWLDEGHLAWFMIDVVAAIDTTAFHAVHPNEGPGRPAYNPDMMLALLLYAYGTGLRSSRRIEAACRTDAAFRVICGSAIPDHATIARFVVDHETAIEASFVEVLRLCAAAGLVTVGTIAIDGTKMAADAAIDQNRQAEWIRDQVARIVAEAAAVDAAEDGQEEMFGWGDLPGELATRSGRQTRLQAALAQIEAADAAARADAQEAAAAADAEAVKGRKLAGRKPKDPHAALARAEADLRAAQVRIDAAVAERAARNVRSRADAAAAGVKLPGRKPIGLWRKERAELERLQRAVDTARVAAEVPPAALQANITDPDSRIMKTKTGFVQGYNCQAAVNERQIVVAAAVTQQANDYRQYQPMVDATIDTLNGIGITIPIEMVLADAGYWSDANATAAGPDRLIATVKDWKQRRAARELGTTTGPPPPHASPLEAMEHRLRTPQGAARYAERSHTVEPVFGNEKHNRGWNSFRRRGLPAVSSEWKLINISHNLSKLFDHQRTTRLAAT